jgi:hypothetical protein
MPPLLRMRKFEGLCENRGGGAQQSRRWMLPGLANHLDTATIVIKGQAPQMFVLKTG